MVSHGSTVRGPGEEEEPAGAVGGEPAIHRKPSIFRLMRRRLSSRNDSTIKTSNDQLVDDPPPTPGPDSVEMKEREHRCTLEEDPHHVDTDNQQAVVAMADEDCTTEGAICLQQVIFLLTLLQENKPQEMLQFMFTLFDADHNGYLNNVELQWVVDFAICVAENYLKLDVTGVRDVYGNWVYSLDTDGDGQVSLEEWLNGSSRGIPLRCLLGMELEFKDDGTHTWVRVTKDGHNICVVCKNYRKAVNAGFKCLHCNIYVHLQCSTPEVVDPICLSTYNKSASPGELQWSSHHWTTGRVVGKCSECRGKFKKSSDKEGQECNWCHKQVHVNCEGQASRTCDFGEYKPFILPPDNIIPIVLDRDHINAAHYSGGACANPEVDPPSFCILPLDPGVTPLLVFVNNHSGGRKGPKVFERFKSLLNPRQVYLMSDANIKEGFKLFQDLYPRSYRVIVCGGDGSIGWVMNTMDSLPQFAVGLDRPPIAILPLGTGNDLSRCLGWGGGYKRQSLLAFMDEVLSAKMVNLDRFNIVFERLEIEDNGQPIPMVFTPPPFLNMNNYFSLGVDAFIALKFGDIRKNNPSIATSATRNKILYMKAGLPVAFKNRFGNLHLRVEIQVDGHTIDLTTGPTLQGILILNIKSVYGGSSAWKVDSRKRETPNVHSNGAVAGDFKPPTFVDQAMDDGQIEVIGIESAVHAGLIAGRLKSSGRKLGQGHTVTVKTVDTLPMQIDGEPWMQPPSVITLTYRNSVLMAMKEGEAPTRHCVRCA